MPRTPPMLISDEGGFGGGGGEGGGKRENRHERERKIERERRGRVAVSETLGELYRRVGEPGFPSRFSASLTGNTIGQGRREVIKGIYLFAAGQPSA